MNAVFAVAFLKYLMNSRNRHSVHSPFIYKLISEVFKNQPDDATTSRIEAIRKKLLDDKTAIVVEDFGEGGKKQQRQKKTISSIVAKSAKQQRYCRLLYNLCLYYRPANILELGTSFGISTMYLSAGNPESSIITIEGSRMIADIARSNFSEAPCNNIMIIDEKFETGLPRALSHFNRLDLVFIDGNHGLSSTLAYFHQCLARSHKYTIFVIDDINWSHDMQQAWEEIKKHEKVYAAVNVFMMGLVFLNPELSKEEFIIRYY